MEYIKHIIYKPGTFHWQWEDLSRRDFQNIVCRMQYVAQVVSPLASFCRPIEKGFFLSALAVRTISTGKYFFESLSKEKLQILLATVQLLLTGAALSSAIFNYTIGLYVRGVGDICQNIVHIYAKDYSEIFPLIASSLYLAVIHTGSLEITLAFLIVQALISYAQAYKQWKNDDYCMAGSKLLMGCIHTRQAIGQYQQIQRRNVLLKIEKLRELFERINAFRKVDDIKDHPFQDFASILGHQCVLVDLEGNPINFGTYLNRMGKGLVKGMNISVKEDGDRLQVGWKLNHIARDKLQEAIDSLKSYQDDFSELMKMKKLPFDKVEVAEFEEDRVKKFRISFGKDISITLGRDPDQYNSYDNMQMHVAKTCNQFDMHGALSLVGLEQAIRASTLDDIKRLQIGQLFRFHNPKMATELERTEEFFTLSTDRLQEHILGMDSTMRPVFERLKDMEFRMSYVGKERMHLTGLADDLKKEGAQALTAMICTGEKGNDGYETSFAIALERLGNMLKTGMLSLEKRQELGIVKPGLTFSKNWADYWGSKDSVFLQLVTENTKSDFSDFLYSQFNTNGIRLLIDLEAIDSITYQYYSDNYGGRSDNFAHWYQTSYKERPDIYSFVKDLVQGKNLYPSQEVMVKDYVDPKFIKGMVVQSDFDANWVKNFLIESDMAYASESLGDMLMKHNNKSLDEFVQIVPAGKAELTRESRSPGPSCLDHAG